MNEKADSATIDSIVKVLSGDERILSADLFQRLKPFFDFRSSLIHRYRTVDDARLIDNILKGRGDFDKFIEEIEIYLESQ